MVKISFQWQELFNNRDLLLPLSAVTFIIIIGGTLTNSLRNNPLLRQARNKAPQGKTQIMVKNMLMWVELADTPSKWQLGLSERKKLKGNEGMLFDYGGKRNTGIWMKDMLFPIDIIWIVDNQIIQIDQKVQHPDKDTSDDELNIYFPLVPIEYVLEVNAGFVEKYGIAVRDPVNLGALSKPSPTLSPAY